MTFLDDRKRRSRFSEPWTCACLLSVLSRCRLSNTKLNERMGSCFSGVIRTTSEMLPNAIEDVSPVVSPSSSILSSDLFSRSSIQSTDVPITEGEWNRIYMECNLETSFRRTGPEIEALI